MEKRVDRVFAEGIGCWWASRVFTYCGVGLDNAVAPVRPAGTGGVVKAPAGTGRLEAVRLLITTARQVQGKAKGRVDATTG